MKALTQCWFTRMHVPHGRPRRQDDGSHSSWCRHCERDIVSWDRSRWFLANGFNVTLLAETVGGRFLFVLDSLEEVVIARYPVHHIADEAEIDTLKAELRASHGIDQPGSGLELHDSAPRPAPARTRKPATLKPLPPAPSDLERVSLAPSF